MFKTGQPGPERSKKTEKVNQCGKDSTKFETLEQLSDWLDNQLAKLELEHAGFVTSDSVRSFFKRR